MKQGSLGTLTILWIATPILLGIFVVGAVNQGMRFTINMWMPLMVVVILTVTAGLTGSILYFINLRRLRTDPNPTLNDNQYFSSLRLNFENRLTKGGLGRLLIELPMRLDKPKANGSYVTTVEDIADRYYRTDGSRRLALLGYPGSGKSVSLRRIGLRLVKMRGRSTDGVSMDYIPVYIDLSEPVSSYQPAEMIMSHLKKAGLKHRAHPDVSQDNLLLLLDGLNEIPGKLSGNAANSRNTRIGDLLSYLENDFTGVFILTSRVSDYAIYERTRKFYAEKIYIEELSPHHIRDISSRHFSDPDQFLQHLCAGDNLRARIQLMKNLQALHMMIELFHDSKNSGGKLSGNIFELYNNYVDYLYAENGRRLKRANKQVKRLPKDKLMHHLRILARDMMQFGYYSCDIQWAESRLRQSGGVKLPMFNNEKLIWEGQQINILVNSLEETHQNTRRNREQEAKIKFAHQTLYEYFAEPYINLDKGSEEERINTVNRLGSMGTFSRLKMVDLVEFYLEYRDKSLEAEQSSRTAIIKIALAYNAETGTKLILLILIESLIRLYEYNARDIDYRISKVRYLQNDFALVREEQSKANLIDMIVDLRHKAIAKTRDMDLISDVDMFIRLLLDPEDKDGRVAAKELAIQNRNKSLIRELQMQYLHIFSEISHKLVDIRRKPFASRELIAEVILELFRIIWVLENRIEDEVTDIDFVLEKDTWIERRMLRYAQRIRDEDDN